MVLVKELIQTPMKKRLSRFGSGRRDRKLSTTKSISAGSSGGFTVRSEYIFCILNEKQIFEAL